MGCAAPGWVHKEKQGALDPLDPLLFVQRPPGAPTLVQQNVPEREHSGNIQGTFGNIQGTFKEHSGNTQGTFSVSWRTPVSPHPNCKNHFKKSTKVDAEYNEPT